MSEVHPIVRINELSLIHPDKAVYVIDIPNSEPAPHQSQRDKKYYIRSGGNSVPASHRMVMDILSRQKHPTFDIQFKILGEFVDEMGRSDRARRRKYTLVITAKNNGNIYAKYVNIILTLPPDLLPNVDIWSAKQELEEGEKVCKENLKNTRRDIIDGEEPHAQYGPSWFDPILPGVSIIG